MVDKLNSASKPLEVTDKINEIIDNLGDNAYDQVYNANSTNAQSGKAVAQAISTKQDTLTGTNGITVDQDHKTVSIDGAINNNNIFNENNLIVTGASLYNNIFNRFSDTTNSYLMKRYDTDISGQTSYAIGPSTDNIGNESTPVFFENGIAKPCTLTVEDTRFDGPWVDDNTSLDMSSIGAYDYRAKGTDRSINYKFIEHLGGTVEYHWSDFAHMLLPRSVTPLEHSYMLTVTMYIGRKHEDNGYNTSVYIYDRGRGKTAGNAQCVLSGYADGSKTQEYISTATFVVYPDSDFYVSVQGTSKAKNLLDFYLHLKSYRRLGTNQ